MDISNFDSSEELHFYWYIHELYDKGIIKSANLQPKSFVLNKPFIIDKTKPMKKVPDKIIQKTIIPEKVYTSDVKIIWNETVKDTPLNDIFYTHIIEDKITSYVEVKGTFDMHNMIRIFKTNQAVVWDKYDIYVNLVQVPTIFKNTFTPDRYLYQDVRTDKKRLIKFKTITLNEFLSK